MGRSVSFPSGAHVAFDHWETDYEDAWQTQDDWDDIIEYFKQRVREHYPSAWEVDKWVGREDHALFANGYAYFGVSEYCGCIAYWIVPRDDIYGSEEGLAQRWFNQVGPKFIERFATLHRLGTFSNGEAIYQRIAA